MRKIKEIMDVDALSNVEHNDASGAKKVIIVEPVVLKAVTATDIYPFGSLVKVTGTAYTLNVLNKNYDPANSYVKGEIVAQGSFVWLCVSPTTGTFDSNAWENKAPQSIGPVAVVAGSVVCCGQWHNTVSAIGFLCDDGSIFR